MIDDLSQIETLQERIEILEETLIVKDKDLERLKARDERFHKLLSLLNSAEGSNSLPATSEDTFLQLTNRYITLMEKGRHMEIIEGAIKADESVANAWKQFAVMLRMAGFDGEQ